MADYIFVLGTAAIVWIAFSLHHLLETFKVSCEDYRQAHKMPDL
jgi:hypothetical protein